MIKSSRIAAKATPWNARGHIQSVEGLGAANRETIETTGLSHLQVLFAAITACEMEILGDDH